MPPHGGPLSGDLRQEDTRPRASARSGIDCGASVHGSAAGALILSKLDERCRNLPASAMRQRRHALLTLITPHRAPYSLTSSYPFGIGVYPAPTSIAPCTSIVRTLCLVLMHGVSALASALSQNFSLDGLPDQLRRVTEPTFLQRDGLPLPL